MAQPRLDLPTGTVTFLRTDVEGSMRLAAALGSRWDAVNKEQLDLIRGAIDRYDGRVVRTEGDAVFAAFGDATAAVGAAIAAQRELMDRGWPEEAPLRVRIGLHSGEAHLAGDDYGGFDVNRAARIASVGHGGQIVLSDSTRALVEAGLPPGASIRDLGRHLLKDVPHPERLFQLEVPGLPAAFPPLRSRVDTPGNLPPRLTSFIGRETELGEAHRLLAETRLLTISGPGGIGKTSLGIELGRRAAGDVADGAWLVELAEITDADEVPTAIGRALGLYDGPGRTAAEGVVRHLEDRQSILVLDNFEHVLAAAPFVGRLLRGAEGLRIVVTSRAPLRIAGEREFPVGPLAGDDGEDHAVRLFLDRARAARPGWNPDAIGVVGQICDGLDRLPLGIELAAARVALLSPQVIRDRLVARLPLPSAGRRDVPDRQRTLESTIAWSHDLLDDPHRRLFRRLGVFEGGFDLEQAGDVAAADGDELDVLDGVIALADQSLLVRDTTPDDGGRIGGLRFRMLETIRSFALRQLDAAGETEATRTRHAEAFLALAELAARHWLTGDQARWLERLGEDHANLRAALDWSIERGPVEAAQRLSAALWRYWQFGGHLREGRELAERVAALAPDEPTPARLWALGAAGGMAYWQADTVVADRYYREQLAVARQVGDLAGEADALFNLSATDFILGGRKSAMDYLLAARAAYEQVGDGVGSARTRWGELNVLMYEDRMDEAAPMLAGLEDAFKQNGDLMYQALSAGSIALVHALAGNFRVAIPYVARSLAVNHAMRDTATTTLSLAACAIVFPDLGSPREAATLLGAYDALSERFGVRPPAGLGYILDILKPVERTIQALRAEEYAAAYATGARMSLDEAVAYTLDVLSRLEEELRSDQPSRG